MKFQVSRFGVLQGGKVLAILYAFFAVLALPFAIFAAIRGNPGAVFMVLAYPLFGFIGGIIGACFYNLAAKITGGIVLELEGEII